MKFIAIIASLFLLTQANAHDPSALEESRSFTCNGITHQGDQFTVMVHFAIDPTWMEQSAPFSFNSGKRAYIQVKVKRDGSEIYNQALYTNDLDVEVVDDLTTWRFQKLELEKQVNDSNVVSFNDNISDYLVVNRYAESNDTFDFELLDAFGNFKNGDCN